MAGNYSFGVARVLGALRPLDRRLTPAAWLLARRCLLALAEQAAKHTVFVPVPAQTPSLPPSPCRALCLQRMQGCCAFWADVKFYAPAGQTPASTLIMCHRLHIIPWQPALI